ncbi:hypothetical protein JIG36_36105 [Actinoplanes sp. LDG1-06]|uniref:Integral membrane protein n=1 Tax=Paractinoplanes ovalisporus TaxID=2810368 RepID=A0ABS2AM58_9ACTN|nr:hypothetical protein [Actinoplanes ovalisporus]MBM2620938.1 hypothetical protein [Actinoplanes ovalisporus]
MTGTVVDRIRPMAVAIATALLSGAVIVLSPLLAGAWASDRSVTVVNLAGYPNINDSLLDRELEKAGGPADILIIIPPADLESGAPDFDCSNEALPKSCPVLHDFPRRIVASDVTAFTTTLIALYRAGPDDEGQNVYVRTGERPLSDTVAWGVAWKVGLVMTVVAAAAVFVALRRRSRVLPAYTSAASPVPPPSPSPSAEPAPARVTQPATGRVPQPAAGRGGQPAPVAPTPISDPLPADAIPPPGTAVVARTHFGPYGGYVDAGGVVLWARLIDPGGGVVPGQSMTVIGPARAQDALVVSPNVTEEVRR